MNGCLKYKHTPNPIKISLLSSDTNITANSYKIFENLFFPPSGRVYRALELCVAHRFTNPGIPLALTTFVKDKRWPMGAEVLSCINFGAFSRAKSQGKLIDACCSPKSPNNCLIQKHR